jgi:hypothetical protein
MIALNPALGEKLFPLQNNAFFRVFGLFRG